MEMDCIEIRAKAWRVTKKPATNGVPFVVFGEPGESWLMILERATCFQVSRLQP